MWSRLFAFAVLTGCIWIGVEIYTEGTQGAFGGVFAGLGSTPAADGQRRTPLERIQSSASGSRDKQLSRIERQLDDSSVGLQARH